MIIGNPVILLHFTHEKIPRLEPGPVNGPYKPGDVHPKLN
jgi:hypothetical protein